MLVPKALLDTQKQYMGLVSNDLYDQTANTIDFDRDTPFTQRQLEDIHDTLTRAIRNREYLIMTPETVQALELRYIECRKKIKENKSVIDPALEDKTMLLGDILRILRVKGTCIIDEADTVLDPRRELNFTLKDGSAINPLHLNFVRQIYEFLTLDPEIASLVKLRENQQVSTSKENYPKVKKALADHFSQKFCKNEEEKKLFLKYVMGDKTVEHAPDFIKQKSDIDKDLIAVLREELNTYLPLSLSHSGFQDYAFSGNSKVEFAIPALHSQPVEGAQFGNHYEAMNYTLQIGLQAGLKPALIGSIVNKFQMKARSEMKRGTPLSETNAYKSFAKMYPHKGLFAIEERDWKAIAEHINKNTFTLLNFIEGCLLNQILLYPDKLTSDPSAWSPCLIKFTALQELLGTASAIMIA